MYKVKGNFLLGRKIKLIFLAVMISQCGCALAQNPYENIKLANPIAENPSTNL